MKLKDVKPGCAVKFNYDSDKMSGSFYEFVYKIDVKKGETWLIDMHDPYHGVLVAFVDMETEVQVEAVSLMRMLDIAKELQKHEKTFKKYSDHVHELIQKVHNTNED